MISPWSLHEKLGFSTPQMERGRSTLWTVDAGDGHQAVPMLPHGGFPAAARFFFLGGGGVEHFDLQMLLWWDLNCIRNLSERMGNLLKLRQYEEPNRICPERVYPRFESRTSFPWGTQWAAHQSSKSIMSLKRQRSHGGVTSTASELRWPNKIWIDSKRSTPSATRWAGTPSERKGGDFTAHLKDGGTTCFLGLFETGVLWFGGRVW